MKHLNKLAFAGCTLAFFGLMTLAGCEGGDIFEVDSPDWISEKVDSIANSKNTDSDEEVLEGMEEDVYTIGLEDYTSGFWTQFSKYYVVPDGERWDAVFTLHMNPSDNTYYKNFGLVMTNDVDRSGDGYAEYGVIRYDFTNDSTTYNSQWGDHFFFKYSTGSLPLSPTDSEDSNVQQLGGRVTLTVDRTRTDSLIIRMKNANGVTKTYTQPYKEPNLNTDASNRNVRCFLVPEGSYITFEQSNVEPIGGYTSAEDKAPLSMVLNNVPEYVNLGTPLDTAMVGVTATVTYEQSVTAEVDASELTFTSIPDMTTTGKKTLVAVYNKTFKGENADTPITATAEFEVIQKATAIEITTQPTRTTYYYYNSAAVEGVTRPELVFDPTGMVVTATYEGGTSGVVANERLTFSTIPAEVGSHTVTITVDEAVAEVTVNVAESTPTHQTMTPAELGTSDCATGWWTVFTDDVQINPGETKEVKLTNYSSGVGNWNNYVVILRQQDLTEYAVVRADNYGWDGGIAGYTGCLAGTTATDWATWLAAMNGAKVTIYVTNCGNGNADVQAIVQGNDGNTYNQYYLGLKNIVPENFYVSFTVDSSYLVFE